jgi:hypothetical protein
MQVRGIVLLPFMEWLGGWGQLYALIGTIVVVIGLFVRAKQLDRDTPRVYLGRRPGALSKELMAEVDRELRGDD